MLRTGQRYTTLYQVKAYFRDRTVVKYFVDKYDAIDFRDTVDAHYPLKVTFEKELQRVLIHGVLHYMGYKDKTEEEKQKMRNKEDECLQTFSF